MFSTVAASVAFVLVPLDHFFHRGWWRGNSNHGDLHNKHNHHPHHSEW